MSMFACFLQKIGAYVLATGQRYVCLGFVRSSLSPPTLNLHPVLPFFSPPCPPSHPLSLLPRVNVFVVVLGARYGRAFYFKAETEDECDNWVAEIEEAALRKEKWFINRQTPYGPKP